MVHVKWPSVNPCHVRTGHAPRLCVHCDAVTLCGTAANTSPIISRAPATFYSTTLEAAHAVTRAPPEARQPGHETGGFLRGAVRTVAYMKSRLRGGSPFFKGSNQALSLTSLS